jgi:hypothetical protein
MAEQRVGQKLGDARGHCGLAIGHAVSRTRSKDDLTDKRSIWVTSATRTRLPQGVRHAGTALAASSTVGVRRR